MRTVYGLVVLAMAGGLGAVSTPAAANGPDGIQVSCSPDASNTASSCSGNGGGGAAAASVQIAPFVLLKASATNAGGFANATAYLGWDFNIVGGSIGDIVDIAVTTKMTTSQTGTGSANAQFSWENPSVSNGITICASSNPAATACFAGESDYSGTVHFDGTVGDLQHLQLSIAASGGFGGSGSATADPFIQITGITDQSAIYTVETLGGVANALPGGVPEPAAWAMMLAGFAGVGTVLRRRRAFTA